MGAGLDGGPGKCPPPPRLPASTDISIMAAKAGDIAHNRLELLAIKVSGCFSKVDKKLLPFPFLFVGGGTRIGFYVSLEAEATPEIQNITSVVPRWRWRVAQDNPGLVALRC